MKGDGRVRLIATQLHMYSDDRGDKEHAALGPHAVSDNGGPSQGMRTVAGFIETDANRRLVRVVERALGTSRDKGLERGGGRRTAKNRILHVCGGGSGGCLGRYTQEASIDVLGRGHDLHAARLQDDLTTHQVIPARKPGASEELARSSPAPHTLC